AGVREGANYLAVCDNAVGSERVDGSAIAAGIRQVIAGESGLFSHEYACDSPVGQCWFVLTITGYRADGAARAVVSRENITERKRAEQLLGLDYTVANQGPDANREPANRVSVANSLLAALPHAEYQRLLTGLEPVTLTFGEVLYAPGKPIRHVYFPIDCLVSLLTMVESRRSLKVGLVGHEGMVGIPLALGINVSPVRALVQGAGTAMRMEAAPFRKELLQSMPLQRVLYRYTHTLMAQFAQTAACNNFHSVKARLARCLLMARDCARSNEFRLTHEFLAQMLGMRRVGVTTAAGALQKLKLISYSRGNIRILDRKGLEAAACKCYRIIKNLRS
ncbi:MAG: Crp/Fnr family transcriptional regulator, partial [Sulfuricaulis sp.]|nr:Crp/Fnr family transcriptional regulator [Sulfuricaulis sp.]